VAAAYTKVVDLLCVHGTAVAPTQFSMQMSSRKKIGSSCAILLSLAVLNSCSADKKADAAQPVARKEGSVDPRPTVVDAPTQPYRAVPVSGGARLTGTVDFDGPMPADSIITIPPEVQGCGSRVTARAVERTGTRIGEAVVWLADIRTGKVLPTERRFELANDECLLTPRVQAVLTPGTLNMASEDVAMHHNHIIDVATGELAGIAPFNDNGEVVPFDRLLTKPAQLEISCTLHPWSKAWILAFDHPYFAVTARNGLFDIADIPAGTYKVKAWHPRLGSAEQTITVASGQPASLALKLGAVAAPAPPAVPDSQ
jgi:hypothetical protein